MATSKINNMFTKPKNLKIKEVKQLEGTHYNKLISLFIDSDPRQLSSLVGETLGKAIVDTGSPHTVAGKVWFESYVNSLSRRDRSSIHLKKSNKQFCFGDNQSYYSKYYTVIPIYIQQRKHYLGVDVINCNIPLLLSHSTLCRADAKVDVGSSTICILGVTSPLVISSSGHLCLSISRCLDTASEESKRLVSRVLFKTPICGTVCSIKNKAEILHTQFCHPKAHQLIAFIKKTGICNQDLENAIWDVTSKCEVCVKIKQEAFHTLKQVINNDTSDSIYSKEVFSAGDKN